MVAVLSVMGVERYAKRVPEPPLGILVWSWKAGLTTKPTLALTELPPFQVGLVVKFPSEKSSESCANEGNTKEKQRKNESKNDFIFL